MKKIMCSLIFFVITFSFFGCKSVEPTIQYIEKEVLVEQCCGNEGINCVAINEHDIAITCKTCNQCLGIMPIIVKETPVEVVVEKEVTIEVPVEIIVEKEVIIEVPVEIIVEKEVIIEVEKVINERCCDGPCMYTFRENTFMWVCLDCGHQRIFENVIKE